MTDGKRSEQKEQTTKAKQKTASEEERIHLWKQHFENLLGKSLKVTHETITAIINQLDIKLGQFTPEEHNSALRKIFKNPEKQQGWMKYPQENRRLGKSTKYCSDIVMLFITKTQYTDGQRDASSLFPKIGNLGKAKNDRGITLTFIAAKIYNALLHNSIEPNTEKLLRKNQNGF